MAADQTNLFVSKHIQADKNHGAAPWFLQNTPVFPCTDVMTAGLQQPPL